MRLILTILCLSSLFIACKPAQYTPKNYKGDQLVIGTSGGVTGMMKEYVLLDNGQLFLSKGISGEWKKLKCLKRPITRDIFAKTVELELGTIKFKHPGNLTYYILLKNPPHTNEIRWGESGIAPPEGVVKFYEYLISLF
ncbi:MAG: hypothetical protein ACOYNC_05820 [Bacteroidales bacterium]